MYKKQGVRIPLYNRGRLHSRSDLTTPFSTKPQEIALLRVKSFVGSLHDLGCYMLAARVQTHPFPDFSSSSGLISSEYGLHYTRLIQSSPAYRL
jgi:hypothetical protein